MTLDQFRAHRTSVLVTLLDVTNVPTEFFGFSGGGAYMVVSLLGGDDNSMDQKACHQFRTSTNTTDMVRNERAWLTHTGDCTSLSVDIYNDSGPSHPKTLLCKTVLRIVDGEQTIELPDGDGSYHLSLVVLKNRQNTVTDQTELVVRTYAKGTCLLEKITQPGHQSVVLWIPGRNDVFMHHHVAKTMLAQGFDLCVYNYTTSLGVTPADRHAFASHVPSGSFDGLLEEMNGVVRDLQSKYQTIVAYAHSTGATILTNYLLSIQKGTPVAFSGIYLNSPFFQWGLSGIHEQTVLRRAPFLMDSMQLSAETVLRPGNRFDSWRARIHTQHEYDVLRHRSDQTVHLTLGFAAACQRVFDNLEEVHHKNQLVTTVPVCLLTTRDDDILDAAETIERAEWFGPPDPNVNSLVLEHGSHDVFLSPLVDEVQAALSHLSEFLYSRSDGA
jgi:alpha-beta hydrolase superfamily lysophospholipase